ncbi:hypothetical protein F2Q69_00026424 [Brassica cretica]|uniref:Uncharacterized protein n=1 Tax=Brassica cretica TaxID=69181 RepID=A0A8S9S0Q7_BRACR|nr:hypothetical protein F2Q69_00026424 [Brassica cretica]
MAFTTKFGLLVTAFQITGTDQFKLIRSLKLLKRPLRSLNKQHFSGISQRVMAQKERVDGLQRRLLTLPDASTAREALSALS